MELNINIRKHMDRFELCTALQCRAGELTAIVGPSGAGKTTLIRLVAGLEMPDQGVIALGKETWTDTATNCFLPPHRRKIGLVFQDYPLFPHLSVRDNIEFGAPDSSQTQTLMDAFGIVHLANYRPGSISGGERQRAAFCQALARQPRVLLLDEPFSALDTATRVGLCHLLTNLKSTLRIPILHVTHDLMEAERLGDAVIAVENGQIAPGWLEQHLTTPLTHPRIATV